MPEKGATFHVGELPSSWGVDEAQSDGSVDPTYQPEVSDADKRPKEAEEPTPPVAD